MSTEQKTKPHKVIYDHGKYLEMQDPAGKMKRYTREQVETLKTLMTGYQFNTVVFKDYSRVRV